MLRMCAVTLGGLFSAFLIFGGELSQDEKASLDALRSERTSIVAVLSAAFNPNTDRQGGYVPTLAELKATGETPTRAQLAPATLVQASFTPAPARPASNTLIATTTVANPEKLATLVSAATAPSSGMILKAVTANRVNVRSGPSTNNPVLGSVVNAEIVRVISESTDGWVKIIVEGDGVEGYMAARFLTDLPQ
jgi:hypothetical protein